MSEQIVTRACGCEASTNDGFLYKTCDLHRDQDPCFKYWPPEVQDMARTRVKAAQAKLSAQPPPDREQLLTDTLSLLRTLEYGSRHLSADGVLVPCCPDCDAEPGQAHSVACRVDGVLRRAT